MSAYFLSIFLGTFVLEDLALTSGIALLSQDKASFVEIFLACFLGISLGDLGLYFLGYAVNFFDLDKKIFAARKYKSTLAKIENSGALSYSIIVSRVIPGSRVPTYVSAGFLGYSLAKFTLLTIMSVFFWVLVALLTGQTLSHFLMNHFIVVVLAFFLVLQAAKTTIPKLLDSWERKTLLYSWRKWLAFEFWPAWFFYLPIVPYYLWLSIRFRNPLLPFYANPNILNGGMIGESKWDFLQHLDQDSSSTLKAVRLPAMSDFHSVRVKMEMEGIDYPFILKPDVGQRGYGVRIIRDDFDLAEYLLLSDFDLIMQKLSVLKQEAGLFFIRKPGQDTGFIFSITDKEFPFVVGDGQRKLGDLILADSRARVIASVYFARLRGRLDDIPKRAEKVYLSECGNHCQGAIFLNACDLVTPQLSAAVNDIAIRIPDFRFGRLDVRYKDVDSLKAGKFEIVEINGAGAEATHIWDSRTNLIDAYMTLFTQWRALFEIGHHFKKSRKENRLRLWRLIQECTKVLFRKEKLSVSS